MKLEACAATLAAALAILLLALLTAEHERLTAAEAALASTQKELWQCVAEQQGASGPLR
jgi:hypothetical protein